jgi:hypothetical protein
MKKKKAIIPSNENEKTDALHKHKRCVKKGGEISGDDGTHSKNGISMSVISNKSFLTNIERYKKLK